MYQERMNSYYPEVIRTIEDFQGIINSEYPEFEDLEIAKNGITENAYLQTMGESRIRQWESILGIQPFENSSLQDRRETIIARIRGQGKLNTELINAIVKTFTGGTANSWVKDSVLYVEVTPPPNDKTYLFANVEQELSIKVPSHLGFKVSRNYYDWGDIYKNNSTWGEVNNNFAQWDDVRLFVPFD